jgi:hypothetical protein
MFITPPIGLMRKKGVVVPPPEFVGLSSNGLGGGNSSIQPGLPTHQEGDLLFLIYGGGSSNSTQPNTTVTGYTIKGLRSMDAAGDGNSYLSTWSKIAGASEVNPTINLSGGTGYKVAALMSFRNHGLALASDLAATISVRENNASSFTTVTTMRGTTDDNSIRIMTWWVNRSGSGILTGGNPVTVPDSPNSTSRLERVGTNSGDSPASGDRGLFIFTGVRPAISTAQLSVSGFQGAADKGAIGAEATIEA